MNPRALRLLAVSALALFLELLLIRYLGVEVRFFMFFKNFVLMASFLGIGIGSGLGRSSFKWMDRFHVIAGLLVAVILFSQELGINDAFIPTGNNAFLWYHADNLKSISTLAFVFGTCLGLTLFVALAFVPLGQALGALIDEVPSTSAYGWDLGGSILGVVAYSATAFLSLSPRLGIVLVLVGAIPLVPSRMARVAAVVVTAGLAVLLATIHTEPAAAARPVPAGARVPEYWWSPYHKVHWEPYPGNPTSPGYQGFLNGYYYFDLLDFRLSDAKLNRGGADTTDMHVAFLHYSVPYAVEPHPESVLLLGAGPGNDAAVALMNGAQHVTAVEIDPAVVRLGKEIHPLKPYLDPRVDVVVDDARAFMARCDRQFDLVSFGHLDSINLTSSFSSVRADSYVYTVESMKNAYDLVKPGGTLSVSFSGNEFVLIKINALLKNAAGRAPRVMVDPYMSTATFIVKKPGGVDDVAREALFEKAVHDAAGATATVPDPEDEIVPTDDWPFLFLRQRALSPYHAVALALLLLCAAAATRLVFFRRTAGDASAWRWSPFWLGAGFMLVETKSITELGLLFGSTWVVTGIGVVGVLAANLVAVAVVRRRSIPPLPLYTALFATIAVNLAIPLSMLLALPLAARFAAAIVLVYSPLVCAGAAFAQVFAKSQRPSQVFGANLLGAMLGGTLEYLSVIIGFRALWILGAVLYALAAASGRDKRDS